MSRKKRKGILPYGKHYQGCRCCCDLESMCYRSIRKPSLQERLAKVKEREQKEELKDR